jgi:hypothetical protein
MTAMLHRFDHQNAFDRRRQLAELDYVTTSRAACNSSPKTTSACRWNDGGKKLLATTMFN